MFTKVAQVAECRTRHTSSYIVEGATTTAAVTHCVCVCTLKREPRRSKAREPFLDTKSKIRLLSLSLSPLTSYMSSFVFLLLHSNDSRTHFNRKKEREKKTHSIVRIGTVSASTKPRDIVEFSRAHAGHAD